MKYDVIVIDPDEETVIKINKRKEIIKSISGDSIFLDHPVHASIFPSKFKNLEKVYKIIQDEILEIGSIEVGIEGLGVFYDDKITNGHTIYYRFDENSVKKIKELQIKVIRLLKNEITADYLKEVFDINKLNKNEIENVKKYGFPYVGENWIPHITLASIEKEKFEIVYKALQNEPLFEKIIFDKLSVHEYIPPNKPKILRTFKFG